MSDKKHLLFILLILISAPVKAQFNTFEVGTGTIGSTFTTPAFTSFAFASEFSDTPLVFVLPSTEGGDECDVRIQNVSTTGFDANCNEASPRDGEHVAVNIQYIAILSGVTTVPTSLGGTVTFEAGSIDTQEVAPDWVLINPTVTDPSNAAIIGQIQTTTNETGTPPSTSSEPFLSTAINASEGQSDEFGLALERSEVNDGLITMDETIAWLTIQNTGTDCIILDLSDLGGPASVPFQSIITDDLAQGATGGDIHGDVDGWNDGCETNEGAEFATMCFTNTPVVLANKRSRNEADGGWLRQCSISTDEIRLTIDEDRDGDNERNHVAEELSVLAFGLSFNTPVTLSHISINQLGRNVSFEWETSTETFNIGFNVWGELNGEWLQLNKRIIPSSRKDQLKPNQYSKTIRLSGYQYEQITKFGVSSVDVSGKDEFFGPVESGESYGEQIIPEPIDWSAVKAKYVQRMKSKGFRLIKGAWRKPSSNQQPEELSRIDMAIPETGIYRVSFEDIQALGLNWSNKKARRIAVTHKGKPVARYILGKQKGRFKPGGAIEFFATIPRGSDARYIDTNVYQLQLDQSLALPMPLIAHNSVEVNEGDASTIALSISSLTGNKIYNSLASDDPWMDAGIFSFGSPVEQLYSVPLPDIVDGSAGRLRASFVGGIDLAGAEKDHHVLVYVNDILVVDKSSDGFARFDVDEAIPDGVLINGDNTIRVVVPGDTGLAFDLVNIDTLNIYSGQELSWSSSQQLPLQFIAPEGVNNFKITLNDRFRRRQARIYVTQQNGNVARVTRPKRQDGSSDNSVILPVTAMQTELDEDVYYWFGNSNQMLTPELNVVQNIGSLVGDDADYLIIAHPIFMNQELSDFAESKTNSGIYTEIVSWLDIVEQYGYGLSTPEALREFLTAANLQSDYEYVLLVGGHSYDYLDYLGNGSVNFIPAWYSSVDIIQQAPTDTPFVDLDADGLPDKAIGRWPVRTQQDLTAIITKTYEWQESGINASRNSLFVAGKTEANRDYDQLLVNAMTPVTKRWSDIEQVFLDDLIDGEGSNANVIAKQKILDNINQGVSLTVFNGHGSPSAWALDSLLTSNDVLQLENTGLPTLLMPLACYTTYYETPSVDSMAHQWLFSSQDSAETQGAVGIHGATVFSDFRENTLFAQKVLKRQLENNETVGQAILSVKKNLSPWHNMVNNWGLLGDPSLRLVP